MSGEIDGVPSPLVTVTVVSMKKMWGTEIPCNTLSATSSAVPPPAGGLSMLIIGTLCLMAFTQQALRSWQVIGGNSPVFEPAGPQDPMAAQAFHPASEPIACVSLPRFFNNPH